MTPSAVHPTIEEWQPLVQGDGVLSAELANHLANCPDCQLRIDQLAMGETDWLLHTAKATSIVPPPELLNRLHHLAQPNTGDTLAALDTLPDATVEGLLPSANGERHRIGPYEVLAIIGRGGMGIVLQGFDVVLQRTVALKIPHAAMRSDKFARERFLREARAAASISHTHVVPVLAVEEYANVPVLVMEYIQGESLQQRLDRERTIPVEQTLQIALQTAEALEAAHARGLVHRDIKPANILLQSPDDHVRLTDFGLARAADDARLTQSGLGAGTPLYMSPEQARGEAVDGRSDLFSLGSVIFTMLAGRSPFATSTLMGTIRRLADGEPDSLRALVPKLPRTTEELVMDLLKQSPSDRPSTASIVIQRLRDCIHFIREGSEPPRQRRRRRVLTLAGLFFAVAIATAGTVMKFPTTEGLLVVEIDDPETKVTYDRNGQEVTISGIGIQEIKLKLGKTPIKISGKAGTREELVTINRGEKTIIKASIIHDAPRTTGIGLPNLLDPFGNPGSSVRIPMNPAALGDPVPQPNVPALGEPINPPVYTGFIPATGLTNSDRFTVPERPMRAVAVSPDGKYLIGGTTWPRSDGIIRVWESDTRKLRWEYVASKGDIPCLILSPDGKFVILGTEDGHVQFWDYASGKLVSRVQEHKGLIIALTVSPDGNVLASAGDDLSIHLREIKSGRAIKAFVAGKNRIRTLQFSPDGTKLLSGGEDQAITMWDVATGKPLWTQQLNNGWIEKVLFLDNQRFVVGNRILQLGSTDTGKTLPLQQANQFGITDIQKVPQTEQFVTCGSDGMVMLYGSSPGEHDGRVLLPHRIGVLKVSEGNANQIAFSADGKTLYVSCGGQYNDQTKVFVPTDVGIRKIPDWRTLLNQSTSRQK